MATTHLAQPATLVAIAVAARKSGDRTLERVTLRELRDAHGIRVAFICRPLSAVQFSEGEEGNGK